MENISQVDMIDHTVACDSDRRGLDSWHSSPRYQESLTYLVYAYQSNTALLMKGTNRGVNESLIALYRRKCLLVRNEVRSTHLGRVVEW